ncbi:MAG: hypothetical protein RJA02_1855, partial [Armatimonadota bacterium]
VDAEGNVSVRDVQAGAEDAKGIQILSGLAAGDMVVTMSFAPPKDGSKVNVIGPDGVGKGEQGNKDGKEKSGDKAPSESKPAAGASK